MLKCKRDMNHAFSVEWKQRAPKLSRRSSHSSCGLIRAQIKYSSRAHSRSSGANEVKTPKWRYLEVPDSANCLPTNLFANVLWKSACRLAHSSSRGKPGLPDTYNRVLFFGFLKCVVETRLIRLPFLQVKKVTQMKGSFWEKRFQRPHQQNWDYKREGRLEFPSVNWNGVGYNNSSYEWWCQ